MNLSIMIPSAVVWVLLISAVWYAVGYALNTTLLNWHLHRYLRRNKTGTVPDRYMNAGYMLAGPVGWVAWLVDCLDGFRRRRRRRDDAA